MHAKREKAAIQI